MAETVAPRLIETLPDGRRRYAQAYYVLPPMAGGAPTADDQVDASLDDAFETESSGAVNTTFTVIYARSTSSFGRYWSGLRFDDGPFPPSGAVIDVAYIELYLDSTTKDDANFDIHAEAAAGPAAFSTSAFDITGRTRTTASVAWVADGLGTGFKQSPSIVSVIQEVVDSFTPTAIVLILKPKTDTTKSFRLRSFDGDPTLAAKLHLEWTEGGALTLTPSPVTAPTVIPAPTVNAGAVTLTPSPVAILSQVPLIASIVRAVTLTPSSVAMPLAAVDPTVVVGAVSQTPAPVTMPFVVPNATLVGAGATVLVADPVTMPAVVPDPTVAASLTLSPSPVTMPLDVVAPQLAAVAVLTPSPVAIVSNVPDPSYSVGVATLAPDPVAIVTVIPTHPLVGVGEAFTTFGNITRLIAASDFPAGTGFFFEVTLKTQDPSHTAKARLFNVTDGIMVAGSELTTGSTSAQRLRSAALTLPSAEKEYRAEFGGDAGGTYTCYNADVIVDSG